MQSHYMLQIFLSLKSHSICSHFGTVSSISRTQSKSCTRQQLIDNCATNKYHSNLKENSTGKLPLYSIISMTCVQYEIGY